MSQSTAGAGRLRAEVTILEGTPANAAEDLQARFDIALWALIQARGGRLRLPWSLFDRVQPARPLLVVTDLGDELLIEAAPKLPPAKTG